MAISKKDIEQKILLIDGAMGTMLQNVGLKTGEIPEEINIENKDIVVNIHKKYIQSGCDILTTNTFGANRLKCKNSKYSLEEIIKAAIENASIARSEKQSVSIALDIGPIGELLEPMGTLSFDEAYEIFKEVVLLGEKYGADLYIIETMTDLNEARAAVLAVKENSTKPVFCTMTFEKSGRTFTGVSPEAMCITLNGLGVDALGVNCSLGPKDLEPVINTIIENCTCPIIVQPNAGLPISVNGKTIFNVKKEAFGQSLLEFIKKGVSIVGGCCGTTEEYIAYIKDLIKDEQKVQRTIEYSPKICTASKVVNINGVKVIGERINPTGKKLFKEALKNNDIDYIIKEAISQIELEADILDVNVGLPEIDEVKYMVKVIKEIQSVTDTPLQIDSNDPKVIEAALRVYNGKAIVNSVNGEEKSLATILPIVKKYGAAVVALTLDENGIPNTAEERVKIAKKIVKRAEELGINRKDVFIDTLTLTVSAQQEQALETIKALRYIRDELGLKTVLGVSNISFGLPNRELLNRTFLTMCLNNGLSLPIVNPKSQDIMDTIRAFKVLNLEDLEEKNYIEHFMVHKEENKVVKSTDDLSLKDIIIKGIKEDAKKATKLLLQSKTELEIVNEDLIPALDLVGDNYEKGRIFLPQLIGSAETVKNSFEILKENLNSNGGANISKGKIVLATVKGDIHDIGKNIVKVILENYGYEIIDLGRDVPIENVVEAAKEHKVKLVGLSALMTTTVKSMEATIQALRDNNLDCKVFVGGAVLNEDYAKMIKADFYAKDAKEAVEIAKKIFNRK